MEHDEIYISFNTSYGKVVIFFVFLFRSPSIRIYLTVIASLLLDILDFRVDCFGFYSSEFSRRLEIIEINKSHHSAFSRPSVKTNNSARLSGKQSLSGEPGVARESCRPVNRPL